MGRSKRQQADKRGKAPMQTKSSPQAVAKDAKGGKKAAKAAGTQAKSAKAQNASVGTAKDKGKAKAKSASKPNSKANEGAGNTKGRKRELQADEQVHSSKKQRVQPDPGAQEETPTKARNLGKRAAQKKKKNERLNRLRTFIEQKEAQKRKAAASKDKHKASKPKKNGKSTEEGSSSGTGSSSAPSRTSDTGKKAGPRTLREKMLKKLKGSKFRLLNEQLYTNDSQSAFRAFQKDASLYETYHEGFRSQVEKWPVNPVDLILSDLSFLEPGVRVADFGCGDAKIAQFLGHRLKVYSFDLAPINEHVTVCDIAHTPLASETVDVAVFCLSLMGTNLADFLREAHRVMVVDGILKVAEIESRFDNNYQDFIDAVEALGFRYVGGDDTNKMFLVFEFQKTERELGDTAKAEAFSLQPCLYKKR